ncbi:hypothetical protein BSZ40_04855 [Buchananella hordeovulneris]|uniref:SAF domain-containing protein n=1 Tax=Buchananella hordeovulneris TaxID=52770 RepID=A0A1Q5PWP9_9ACTO|nr:hypothetical protein BSZ40_04855 [Buchananella hordeovulneris]
MGVLLIAVSVAAGALVVGNATASTTFYVATRTVEVGAAVQAADFVPVNANLGSAADAYATALPERAVARRTIEQGELLANGAIEAEGAGRWRRVVVPVEGTLPASAQPGAVVELWATAAGAPVESGQAPTPALIAESLTIARIADDEAGLGLVRRGTAVELVVPRETVPNILAAVAQKGTLTIVPTGQQ